MCLHGRGPRGARQPVEPWPNRFTVESAAALVERLRGEVGHLLHCGSIWRTGPAVKVPVTEDDGPPPIGEYGIAKAAIADLLRRETASGGLVTTSLHPGHIVGPGWHPIGFRRGTGAEAAETSWEHLVRSHCFSIDKARTMLGYAPRYEPEDAVLESVRWLIEHGELEVAGPLKV